MVKKIYVYTTLFSLLFQVSLYAQFGRGFSKPDRLALVIGNSQYSGKALPNARNDARDMKTALENLGFEVILKEDLTREQFEEALSEFTNRLQSYSVGLFYFAGHGFEGSDNINYLNSIEVRKGLNETMVRRRSVSLNDVMSSMREANNRTNILLVDACRNNPFRSWGRSDKKGLAPVNTPVGTIAFFAASPGQEADENALGRNGLFTQELLRYLETPSLELGQLFKLTAKAVSDLNKYQTPYQTGFITDDFYFKPESSGINSKYEAIFRQGKILFDRKEYKKSLPLIRQAAENGHAEAQAVYGHFYCDGLAVTKDYGIALEWYLKSAAQGNAIGQVNVGYLYDMGYGVLQNYTEAIKWYRMAAEQGLPAGQNNLGAMYTDGKGIEKNDEEAIRLYRLAADQGYALAMNNLGDVYYYGTGVTQSYAIALEWYQKSAAKDEAAAQSNIGHLYHFGYGVAQNFKEAVRWYRKAVLQNEAWAQLQLGLLSSSGEGMPKDEKIAVTWIRKSADQGTAEAQYNLALAYHNGTGLAKNMDGAILWYQKAARQDQTDAQEALKKLGKSW